LTTSGRFNSGVIGMSRRLPANIAHPIRFAGTARLLRVALAGALVAFGSGAVAQAQVAKTASEGGPSAAPVESVAELWGNRLIDRLQVAWPDPPEAVAMFIDILKGSQLGPGEGWYKKAVAQTRYGWSATCKRLDRDGNGRVSREEFWGSDGDFARLDRDRDGALGEPDFDFSAHALSPSPGAGLFYQADRDGNGKLTHQELEGFFRAADAGGEGFLSLADLQQALSPPARARSSSRNPQGPTRLTLLKGLFRQEIGSLQAGPALDSVAPDFTLTTVDGKEEITLSKLVGPKPVVLIFGNFTCGPFRSQAGNVEKLYRQYRDRATFVMVYVREAHPIEGWQLESNKRLGVALAQPRSYEERVKVAQMCSSRLELGMPMLVDTIGDAIGARYSGMPSRLYLIDQTGRVAYKNGRGPFGFKPAELEHSLLLLLQDEFPGLKSKNSDPPPANHAVKR
jgi:thiol-disulfide isomerase/thioredoxin